MDKPAAKQAMLLDIGQLCIKYQDYLSPLELTTVLAQAIGVANVYLSDLYGIDDVTLANIDRGRRMAQRTLAERADAS